MKTVIAPPNPAAEYGRGVFRFTLATGSPGELGLLEALGNAFAPAADATLVWVKAGTGESLRLLRDRQVDMAMVHAPAQLKQALAEGWITGKTLIGANEFYLVGPRHDPAGIAHATSAADAFQRILDTGVPFVSRGDQSGTHQKEMQFWSALGQTPQAECYLVTHDFMTASLKVAHSRSAYFMTDSSTWIMEQVHAPSLTLLYRGDATLINCYHAVIAPAGATAGRDTAARFVDFVASPAGQHIIREYGQDRYAQSLYNDALFARQYD